MDTSDPTITFDARGECSHCREFDEVTSKRWFPDESGRARLNQLVETMREAGRGREYDCVLGVSGGVDSSLLALRAKKWDLRVLAVHVDAGWNTELAVSNIHALVTYCGFDLHTIVMDWEDMRELQLAYLRSGLANQDVPQDHAFFTGLYRTAIERRVKYVLSGGNIATEAVFPQSWHGPAMDAVSLRDVHRRFGTQKLNSYPTTSFLEYFVLNPYVRRMKVVRPLNYMPYNRDEAIAELQELVGFRDYGRKHGESQFTRFFQNFYLPERFGYDKRRPHLSSMILSGLITRDQAIEELSQPLYDPDDLEADKEYFIKKLRLTPREFTALLEAPRHDYSEFRNHQLQYRLLKAAQRSVERLTGRDLRAYG